MPNTHLIPNITVESTQKHSPEKLYRSACLQFTTLNRIRVEEQYVHKQFMLEQTATRGKSPRQN